MTVILYGGRDLREVKDVIKDYMELMENWLKINVLSLNITKTQYRQLLSLHALKNK